MMEPSVRSLIKERKYPFLFACFVLFLCFSLLVSTNNRYSYLSVTDLQKSRLISSSPDNPLNAPPPPRLLRSPSPLPRNSSSDRKEKEQDGPTVPSPPDRTSDGDRGLSLMTWELCKIKGSIAVDYIPCLDNMKAIKALKSRRHMEHRERHCPDPSPRCLLPLPQGYKIPVPWPRSRDMIWFDNVPHPKLVEFKKDQNWVRKSGDYLVFPGGGTQFKGGVQNYVEFIEKTLPNIGWGKQTRIILDVGCGVASFGGYLLEKDVLTMSFAPKDEHEAQIQFALERGIPAILSVIATHRLTFPDNVYDLIHCARCRVHWDGDGGKPLMELNRILRPGGFFIWSATPVYRDDSRDLGVWNSMVALTESICWKMVAKTVDSDGIGLVLYQKPTSNTCYEERKESDPPLCDQRDIQNTSWYAPLRRCLPPLLQRGSSNWPTPWPERLSSTPPSLSMEPRVEETLSEDTKHWSARIADVYLGGLAINWSSTRNVMDMNAGYGGFAAALIDQPLWVMNVVPINGPDTLAVIFDRGLIGIYHDWCEAFNTYPRTYDLLHSSYLFGNLTQRCDIAVVVAEMDRILRPGGWILVQDKMKMIDQLIPIFKSLHWEINAHEEQFLVGKKGFWRPMVRGAKT
ncbi:probable methyltransferase PMT23 [Macadamia integrifolia]|uniref:probable methyltransferase PMT23 n=1 Tax=Macadamia integrifolia TaxID=60698 RepID=UPI001C501E8E|nr:probable methyltransferase PMT23 [Macadamia integrifolia]